MLEKQAEVMTAGIRSRGAMLFISKLALVDSLLKQHMEIATAAAGLSVPTMEILLENITK